MIEEFFIFLAGAPAWFAITLLSAGCMVVMAGLAWTGHYVGAGIAFVAALALATAAAFAWRYREVDSV